MNRKHIGIIALVMGIAALAGLAYYFRNELRGLIEPSPAPGNGGGVSPNGSFDVRALGEATLQIGVN